MYILNGRQGQSRKDTSASGQDEDQHESPPCGGGMLPEAQYPSGAAERKEAEAGDDLCSACEIRPSFMLIEPIGNQTIPSRRSELGTGKICGSSTHDEPRTPLRNQQRQKYDGYPDEGLAYGASRDEGFAIGKPL